MIRNKLYYEIRLHKLMEKDAAMNRNIIKKLQRKIRQCEAQENQ